MQRTGPIWLDESLPPLLTGLGLTGQGIAKAQVVGDDPIEPSRLRLGATMALGHLAFGTAIAELVHLTHHAKPQQLCVDVAAAVARVFPERTGAVRVHGHLYPQALLRQNPLLKQFYRARCGRDFVPSALYPQGLLAWLKALECGVLERDIAASIAQHSAAQLEALAAQHGLPGTMVRTPAEYLATAQGQHEAALPWVSLRPMGACGEARATRWQPQAPRPLAHLRVLTFCRAIAGPTLARTLAEQGADVVHVVMPGSFEHDAVHFEVCVASRSVALDLRRADERKEALRLIAEADVVIDNLRAKTLERLGIHLPSVAAVYASIRTFDEDGPWGERAGFDMTAMAACGITLPDKKIQKGGAQEDGGQSSKRIPCWPPTQLFCDFAAGLFGAAGVVSALIEQRRSHQRMHVQTSLSRMGLGCLRLGVLDVSDRTLKGVARNVSRPAPELRFQSAYGEMLRYGPMPLLSHTPCRWDAPAVTPRGSMRADEIWMR